MEIVSIDNLKMMDETQRIRSSVYEQFVYLSLTILWIQMRRFHGEQT